MHALVTLTGAGGVGKTRLALQAVAGGPAAGGPSGGPPRPDGVWFVDFGTLAPRADAARVAGAVLEAAGAREAPGQPALTALVAHLEPRLALLLLDNCEHVLAACAPLVDAVLRRCPGVRVLATSREPLGVPGEAAWRVPSLALPDPPRPDGLGPREPGGERRRAVRPRPSASSSSGPPPPSPPSG